MEENKMDAFLSLLEERDNIYHEFTYSILEQLAPTVLVTAIEHLGLEDMAATGQVMWQDVAVTDYILTLVALVKYPPGSTYTTESGEEIEVTETMDQEYFTRVIRISIPLELAINGTIEEVRDFLEVTRAEAQDRQEQYYSTLDNLDEGMSTEATDFDLDELTEEQRQKLNMFYKSS